MNKCLVTKLKASTGNTNFLRIGEMRIGITRIDSPNSETQSLVLGFNQPVDLEIIGDGYFTDSTLSSNLGKVLKANTGNNVIYFSNGNYALSISDKYSLNYLRSGNTNKDINIDDLKYSYNLEVLILECNVTGDISALRGLTSLTQLSLPNNNLTGDISALRGMTSLFYLRADYNNLTGDISALSGMTSLTQLVINDNNLTGDISALRGLNYLNYLDISNNILTGDVSTLSGLIDITYLRVGKRDASSTTVTPICSNMASLNTLTKLTELILWSITISGDISSLSPKLILLDNENGVSNCTWSNRPTASNIFAILGSVKFGNIDTMLNNMANCTAASRPSYSWYNTISIRGSRTSASDAAISTLQSKGYTISIVP